MPGSGRDVEAHPRALLQMPDDGEQVLACGLPRGPNMRIRLCGGLPESQSENFERKTKLTGRASDSKQADPCKILAHDHIFVGGRQKGSQVKRFCLACHHDLRGTFPPAARGAPHRR
jgi:hypothetical protein